MNQDCWELVPSPSDRLRQKEVDLFLRDNKDFYSIWFDEGSPFDNFNSQQRVAFTLGYITAKEYEQG